MGSSSLVSAVWARAQAVTAARPAFHLPACLLTEERSARTRAGVWTELGKGLALSVEEPEQPSEVTQAPRRKAMGSGYEVS